LLALGFTLLVLRYIRPHLVFNETLMKIGFWGLNGGLALMILTSLLPIGLFQFYASLSVGMWYARSDAFLQQSFLETLRWIRMIGDVVFIAGAGAIAWQVVILGLWRSAQPKVSGARAVGPAFGNQLREQT
jgi:nitric oxide reductase subunit B